LLVLVSRAEQNEYLITLRDTEREAFSFFSLSLAVRKRAIFLLILCRRAFEIELDLLPKYSLHGTQNKLHAERIQSPGSFADSGCAA
jgi:hypothetical protein